MHNYDTELTLGDIGSPSSLLGGIPTERDAQTAGISRLYALIDTAKIANLREQMDASDLPTECLFQGDALKDVGDAAPWLVELHRDNNFTRALFAIGDAPWDLWHDDVAIFIQSKHDIKTIRSHLRRFLRLRDEHQKWFFFRFYAPEIMRTIVRNSDRIRSAMFGTRIDAISCRTLDGGWLTLVANNVNTATQPQLRIEDIRNAETQRPYLGEKDLTETRRVASFLRRECRPAVATLTADQLLNAALHARQQCANIGIRKHDEILRSVTAMTFWGSHFMTDPQRKSDLTAAGWVSDETPDTLNPKLRAKPLLGVIDEWVTATRADTADMNAIGEKLKTLWASPIERLDTETVIAWMQWVWPQRTARMGAEPSVIFARDGIVITQELNLRGADALGYIVLAVYFGLRFAWDPLYPWARDALLTQGQNVDDRRLHLAEGILSYVDGLQEA